MNNMIQHITNFLLRASLTASDLTLIRDQETGYNFRALRVYSIMAAVFFWFTVIIALVMEIPSMLQKTPAYAICGIFTLLTLAMTFVAKEKNHGIIRIASYIFYLTILAFGLYVSLASSPTQHTISLIGLYTIVPLLFIIKPIQILLLSEIANVIFLILSPSIKPAEILSAEMINSLIFSTIGIFVGMFNVRHKYQRMLFEKRVSQFSTNDTLTHNLRSLADIYVSMHLVNLDNDTFIKIQSKDHIDSNLSNSNEGFSKQVEQVMKATTKPEYVSEILQFVNTKTLPERLKGNRSITHEFQGKYSGWCRARFIAVGQIAPDIPPSEVIYAVESIDEQKKLESTLITKAETDAMTGLLNRQAGIEKIDAAIKSKKKGLLALFDVDKFKSINDNYGHQMGDEVIIAVARAMQETFRSEDILLRLGGDEYVFFVNGIENEERGIQIINRFFSTLEKIKFEKASNLKISISLGATLIEESKDIDFVEYYHRADSSTYQSKKIDGMAFTFWKE